MDWMTRRFLVGALAWAIPTIAWAQGEPCLRDTECAGVELCVDASCTASSTELPTCEVDDDCDDGVCVDGACKQEGVVCRNPAGTCWVEDGSGHCDCADGLGSGWSDGYNPDDPPDPQTDEQLAQSCTTDLVDACGSEAPTLPDTCVGEVKTACEAYVAKQDALAQACGEDVPDVNIGRIGECCNQFDEEGFAEYRACVTAIEAMDCAEDELAACEGDGGEPAGGELDDEGTKSNDGDGSKAGCSIATTSSAWTAALLLAVAWRRRRRAR